MWKTDWLTSEPRMVINEPQKAKLEIFPVGKQTHELQKITVLLFLLELNRLILFHFSLLAYLDDVFWTTMSATCCFLVFETIKLYLRVEMYFPLWMHNIPLNSQWSWNMTHTVNSMNKWKVGICGFGCFSSFLDSVKTGPHHIYDLVCHSEPTCQKNDWRNARKARTVVACLFSVPKCRSRISFFLNTFQDLLHKC